MTAGAWDFRIEAGATFEQRLLWKDAAGVPVPLAGLTARMQIRRVYGSWAEDGLLAELTTENGAITLTTPGQIDLRIAAEDTTAIGALGYLAGRHALEIVDPTVTPARVTRLLEGSCAISAEIAQEAVA
jgi:hypothetical protein